MTAGRLVAPSGLSDSGAMPGHGYPSARVEAIDVHSHFVPKGWPNLEAAGGSDWPWLRMDSERDAMIMVASREFRRISENAWRPETRLSDMDASHVAAQVVSPTPLFFSYGRDIEQAVRVSRIFNDLALEMCSAAPDRLLPFCQVPLQDPDEACKELDRCLEAGHVGVEIGNHVGDRDLDDEGIVTFLQHCADTGTPVFVHPWDMPESKRESRWMARWLTGMPAETHLSILAMILGGVFDRVPDSLRICFAHGGGSFAFWLGRLENAWRMRPDVVRGSLETPSSYLGRFFVDSVVFDHRALRFLVDVVGVGNVMMGSDYPYPLGEFPPGASIRDNQLLDEAEQRDLLRGNAERFLGSPVSRGRAS